MPTPTITNVLYTIDGVTKPLTAGTRFYVGQQVWFSAILAGGGSLTVFKRIGDISKGAVAWSGRAWTVGEFDLPINCLRFNHRRNKVDQPDLIVAISVAAAPVASSPPPSKDEDPIPTVPGDNSGEPARRSKMGMVALAAIDPAAKVSSALWKGVKTAANTMLAAGITGFREWHSLGQSPKWDRIRQWINAGVPDLAITLNWPGKDLPTVAQISKYVQAFIDSIPADVRPHIKFVAVGNEPGIGSYWKEVGANKTASTDAALKNFVTLFLNPAYDLLKAAGFTVAVGGFNGAFADQFKVVRDAGGKFDLVDVHCYQRNTVALDSEMEQLKSVLPPGLEIVSTEWNVFLGDRYREFLDGAADSDPGVSTDRVIQEMLSQDAIVAADMLYQFYFVSYRDEKWTTGVFGALVPDGKGNFSTSPFYDRYLWVRASSSKAAA